MHPYPLTSGVGSESAGSSRFDAGFEALGKGGVGFVAEDITVAAVDATVKAEGVAAVVVVEEFIAAATAASVVNAVIDDGKGVCGAEVDGGMLGVEDWPESGTAVTLDAVVASVAAAVDAVVVPDATVDVRDDADGAVVSCRLVQ